MNRAKKISEEVSRKRLKLMRRRATRGVRPYTIEEARALQIDSGFTLNEHIGKLFPLILELVAKGESVRSIEVILGIRPKILKSFICRNPWILEHVQAARTITIDKEYPL